MIERRRRLLALAIVGGIAAFALSGCSSTLNNAATVKYHDASGDHTVNISDSEFHDQLQQFVDGKGFAKLIAAQDFNGSAPDSTDARIAAYWLTQMINQVPLDAEFNALHLSVTDADRTQAESLVRQRFPLQNEVDPQSQQFKGPGAVYDGLPKSLQKTLVDAEARSVALQRYFSQPTEEQARAFYAAHQNDICPSGRVVSHILVKTEAQAKAILAQLKAGKSFADLAKQSIDTQSAKAGGQLGCLTKGTYVPVFEKAALAAPFDTPTDPVKSQFGYHVILVEKPTFENLASTIQSAMKSGAAIDDREKNMKVTVDDKRIGTVALDQTQQGTSVWRVTAPATQTPRTSRDQRVTTTTTPATGG